MRPRRMPPRRSPHDIASDNYEDSFLDPATGGGRSWKTERGLLPQYIEEYVEPMLLMSLFQRSEERLGDQVKLFLGEKDPGDVKSFWAERTVLEWGWVAGRAEKWLPDSPPEDPETKMIVLPRRYAFGSNREVEFYVKGASLYSQNAYDETRDFGRKPREEGRPRTAVAINGINRRIHMAIGSRITKASWRTDSTNCRRTFLDSGFGSCNGLKHSSKFKERLNSRGGPVVEHSFGSTVCTCVRAALWGMNVWLREARQWLIATNNKQNGDFLKVTRYWRINLPAAALLGGR
ncbi:uncharacterized protein K444DRAFT_637369 [Hyaloscypha bicolor E]|uniref:Uncharacterized protein n=1 Tax=Hyaloscypha bicolor E TaxID=1095630 RepID=A0A2J6SN04_9HELO|nr:uncharacterized protein K444DRAFT_637369 [Hyaloscypha bicolor E]PMD52161.1 hypothetical protein K444DRAFT_637369 [Hyaloscypha bicolor E]